jgi:hypothetical protein
MNAAGETYGLPLGWCGFGLPIDPAAAKRCDIFATYHRCFHGMDSTKAAKILNDPMRQLLMRGDTTAGGVEIPCDRGSGDSDFYNHIFTSKSIKYCAYSPEPPHNLGGYYCIKERFRGRDFLVAFQVLQKPDSYTVNRETVGATRAGVNPIDESFPNSEMEWKTKSRGVHFLQRLLVKCVGQAAEPPRGSIADLLRREASAEFAPHVAAQERRQQGEPARRGADEHRRQQAEAAQRDADHDAAIAQAIWESERDAACRRDARQAEELREAQAEFLDARQARQAEAAHRDEERRQQAEAAQRDADRERRDDAAIAQAAWEAERDEACQRDAHQAEELRKVHRREEAAARQRQRQRQHRLREADAPGPEAGDGYGALSDESSGEDIDWSVKRCRDRCCTVPCGPCLLVFLIQGLCAALFIILGATLAGLQAKGILLWVAGVLVLVGMVGTLALFNTGSPEENGILWMTMD